MHQLFLTKYALRSLVQAYLHCRHSAGLLQCAIFSSYRPTRFTDRGQTDPSHRNMTEVSVGKYCQFIILFTKYWGNIITYIPPRISGDGTRGTVPMPQVPLNFPVMPAGLPVEVIAKVPSRYYRVPRPFITVLTVGHNRWCRPTLV